MNWWTRLFGGGKSGSPASGTLGVDDLETLPPSISISRAKAALPGTATHDPILQLVPPPVDPEAEPVSGPDPVAEISLTFAAGMVVP